MDYWKRAYQDKWPSANQREREVAARITLETNLILIRNGLGAESTEFLSGNASTRGYEKGEPDYRVEDNNIYIEVTGSLSPETSENAPLWIRPDKIENAKSHIEDHETWVVHCLTNGLWRVILLDKSFHDGVSSGKYPLRDVDIRGRKETYRSIRSNADVVKPFSALIERLKNLSHSK